MKKLYLRGENLNRLNPKMQEKMKESLTAVMPIVAIVLVLCFTLAPVSPSILLAFLFGALLVMVGMMFFTLGAEMSMTPIGEKVGAAMTRTKNVPLIIILAVVLGVIITISEPDLQVLAELIPSIPNMTLILAVAIGVGLFLVVAILRMLIGTSFSKTVSIISDSNLDNTELLISYLLLILLKL